MIFNKYKFITCSNYNNFKGNSCVFPPLFFFFFAVFTTNRQFAIPGYQNITFNGIILKLCSTNITCDCIFVTFSGSLIYFLTFDGSIVTLGNTNITFYRTFLTFCGTLKFFFSHSVVSLFFFSHLMVSLSH